MENELVKQFFKLVAVGPPGAGKTSCISRYAEDEFFDDYKPTIGADFCTKRIDINGESAVLQLWDTAGQERYRALGGPFYRGASGVLFVFDITEPQSLDTIEMWYDEFARQSGMEEEQMASFPKVLVGNKCDLEVKVSQEDVEAWQTDKGLRFPYIETSAKENTGLEEAFQILTQLCYGPMMPAAAAVPATAGDPTLGHSLQPEDFANERAETAGKGAAVAAGGYDPYYFEEERESLIDDEDNMTLTSDKLSQIMSDTTKPDEAGCGCTLL